MDTTTEGVLLSPLAARLQQTLVIQDGIIRDCVERADYWRAQGHDDRAQVWDQFAENAARVKQGIEATGDVHYCPF